MDKLAIDRKFVENALKLPPSEVKEELEKNLFLCLFDEDENYAASRYVLATYCYKYGLMQEVYELLYELAENMETSIIQSKCYLLVGHAFHMIEKLVSANAYYVKALVVAELIGIDDLAAEMYLHMGVIAIDVGEYERAICYLEKSGEARSLKGIHYSFLIEFSSIYAEGMLDNPAMHAERLRLFIEKNKAGLGVYQYALSNEFLGNLYEKSGMNEKALDSYYNAYNLKDEVSYLRHSHRDAQLMYGIAKAYYRMQNYSAANTCCDKAIERLEFFKEYIILERAVLLKSASILAMKKEHSAFSYLYEERRKNRGMISEVQLRLSGIMDTYTEKLFVHKDLVEQLKELDEAQSTNRLIEHEREELKKGIDRLKLLNDYLVEISKLEDLDSVFEVSLAMLRNVLEFEVFYVAYLDDDRQFINIPFMFSRGVRRSESSIPISYKSLTSYIIQEGRKMIIDGSSKLDESLKSYFDFSKGTRQESAIFIPLENESGVFGVCSVQIPMVGFYSDFDLEIFESFSSILAGAISIIRKNDVYKKNQEITGRLVQEIKQKNVVLKNIGYIDDLTQIFNRQGLKLCLNQLLHSSVLPAYLTVTMADIDYFKHYNDEYGHVMGDEFLVRIASILKETFGTSLSIMTRYGGEEFLIITPYLSNLLVLEKLEKVRNSVLKYGRDLAIDQVTSISIGFYCGEVSSITDVERLISKADDLLYKAKRTGRNKICSSWA